MAGAAGVAKSALVLIILLMAGKTVGGGFLVDAIGVATLAVCAGVLSGQLIRGEFVIVGGGNPAIGGVAGFAIRAKRAIVLIILLVAGNTIGGGAHENMINMAFLAGRIDVFAGQQEF
jgi:hypothetical protein